MSVHLSLLVVAFQQPEFSRGYQQCGLSADACPGSPVTRHAACSITLTAYAPCGTVQKEVVARIQYNMDRKSHPGTYALIATAPGACTKGSRTTGAGAKPGPFTDVFGFTYSPTGSDPHSGTPPWCEVRACSESQVSSKCDFSTNFCNVFNLICGGDDGCVAAGVSFAFNISAEGSSCDHGFACGGFETKKARCTR